MCSIDTVVTLETGESISGPPIFAKTLQLNHVFSMSAARPIVHSPVLFASQVLPKRLSSSNLCLASKPKMVDRISRGALIIFEGVDRCGKSTQVRKLGEYFSATGMPHVTMRFPNRETPTGKIINSYLTDKSVELEDHTVHLLFSANRWECKDSILSALNAGKTVIMDRYAYSGVAFTSAKGLDFEWCKNTDSGLPAPDAVIYLKLSVQDASKRGQYGEERYENTEFQTKVADIFENKLKDDSWVVLDARKSIDELHEEIKAVVAEHTARAANQAVASLWC